MMERSIEQLARDVKAAAAAMYVCPTARKNRLLRAIASRLRAARPSVLEANAADIDTARASGLSGVLLDRLMLNESRIAQMVRGVQDVIGLADPVGEVTASRKRPNGLRITQVRVPLGAVGIIYEARPNVTVDAAVLCLKAGNAVLLRGGSEAIRTNMALVHVLRGALEEVGLPVDAVGFVESTDREAVQVMLKQDRSLDVIIPRGSQQLIRFIQERSTVPVIAHGEGNCHVFVDASADLAMAEEIVVNAKTQRPSVCNAAEKLLIHRAAALKGLPRIIARLRGAGVEVRGDERTRAIVPDTIAAVGEDWDKEYLDLIIAVKVVDDVDAAITHINAHGSHHSDAIVTRSKRNAGRFLRSVDSAAVYVNASTRFTDGYEFGLGAEIGISTQKLHARGPMGLVELTSTKFVVQGRGQVRR